MKLKSEETVWGLQALSPGQCVSVIAWSKVRRERSGGL